MAGHDKSTGVRISRRDWLRIVGASGLTAAAIGAMNTAPQAALAANSTQDDSPEAFLAQAYATRAQAMTTKDVKVLEAIYDPANPQLLAFEKERATFFADLGSRWDGQVFGYNANVSLIDLKMDGFTAIARNL
jgi:hypothetical protein